MGAFAVDPTFDPSVDRESEDLRKNYLLRNEEWKYDSIPEIIDGKNISDFIDPDIEELLDQLEAEELEQLQILENDMDEEDDGVGLTEEEKALLAEVKEAKAILIRDSRLKQKLNSAPIPRKHNTAKSSVSDFEKHLNDMGMDASAAVQRARSKSKSRGRSTTQKRADSLAIAGKKRKRDIDFSPGEGLKDENQKKVAKLKERQSQKAR